MANESSSKTRRQAMRRPQFSIRALLILMLVVAAFFGGIKFERERRIREERAAQKPVLGTSSHGFSVQMQMEKDGTFVPVFFPNNDAGNGSPN
jgi:hypothetical protein